MPIQLEGKLVVVMGLGRFGGGAGAARYAVDCGARVVISDRSEEGQLAAGIEMIEDLLHDGTVTLSLGKHEPLELERADVLIVNPAVPAPWNNAFIRRARELNVDIETEIGLAIDEILRNRSETGRIIAVTGSVGKSTTAAMIAHGLNALGVAATVGGNIGGSLLGPFGPARSERVDPATTFVLELSSAMLHWLKQTRPSWGPNVAVLTGFEPNHLDWHGSLDHYRSSKQWLLDSLGSNPGSTAVLGEGVADWATPDLIHRRTQSDVDAQSIRLPGKHNRDNAGLATAAIEAVMHAGQADPTKGLTRQQIAQTVGSFPGLPHRLAWCGTRRNIHCYNDSKSTTPGTTAAAVHALSERHDRVWLIAGGADKRVDLSSIGTLDIAAAFTIGTTGPAIAEAARTNNREAIECGSLEVAVAQAAHRASSETTHSNAILLSPGCASWDQFKNYESRGDEFIRLLDVHLGEHHEGP